MTLKITIEGPAGSGKSTLARRLAWNISDTFRVTLDDETMSTLHGPLTDEAVTVHIETKQTSRR